MHFSFKKFKKNIIASWAFSYVIVIFVMLIVMAVIGTIYTSTTKQISDEFNNYIFETVTDDVNNTLLSMNNLYVRVNENENLKSALHSNEDIHSLEFTYNLIDSLRSYTQFAENTDEVFVYIKSQDLVIFSGGISSAKTYYKAHITPNSISLEDWKKMLTDCSGLTYGSMPYRTNNNHDIDALSLIFPVSKTQNDCIGVILSDKKYFMKGLEEINLDELCDIYIYNSEGNLVTYSRHSADSKIPSSIVQIYDYKSDDSIIHTSDIVVNGHTWRIATIASDNKTVHDLFLIQALIFTILFISLIILFFIIKKILKKNYSPIKTMLSFFNLDSEKNTNEYEKLFSSIKNTLKENRLMTKKLDNHTKEFEKLSIAKLLRGEVYSFPYESTDYSFPGNFFAVLSFYIENIGDVFDNEPDLPNHKRLSHLTFIVDNVISELMAQKEISVYTTEIDSQVSCLICMKNKIDANEINALAYQGLDFINKNFTIELTYALSAICEGEFGIPDLYRQTTEVLEYNRVLGITEPMQYIEKPYSKSSGYIFDIHKEQAIVNAIKTGNYQAALSSLSQIFDDLSSQKDLPLDHIICIIMDVATTITKSANITTASGVDFSDTVAFYRKLKEGENLVNLYSYLSEYTMKICEIVKNDIQEGKNRLFFLLSHIEKYIADNYTSPELNVTTIGLHFNMNPQYISTVFKKETGKPLLDYINNVRIERALELVKQGKYPKKEIYKMVGFTTERTFYRVLKKYEETQKTQNILTERNSED